VAVAVAVAVSDDIGWIEWSETKGHAILTPVPSLALVLVLMHFATPINLMHALPSAAPPHTHSTPHQLVDAPDSTEQGGDQVGVLGGGLGRVWGAW